MLDNTLIATDWAPPEKIREALSAWPEYMLGSPTELEEVTEGQVSPAVCLAPTSEGHGVRGFIATIIWPEGTTEGVVTIQGADLNQEAAFQNLGTVTYPAVQYSSPSGLVTNFMRAVITTVPEPEPELAARLMIR